ncbi:MAG: hypothetical protein WA843_00870 [Candidatus Saccharimonadales bacterium]
MANPESAEKMQIVVDSLRANPDVVIVGGYEKNYLASGEWPNPDGYWSRTLDIYTHPKNPMYNVDELNELMFSLVPELKPTLSDRFRGGERQDGELELGKLYYDEAIGTAALSATVQLKEGLSVVRSGLLTPQWKVEETKKLNQRTWVRVFPDAGHLADAAVGHNKFRIPTEELFKRSTGRIVSSLFEAPMLGGVIEAKQPQELEA